MKKDFRCRVALRLLGSRCRYCWLYAPKLNLPRRSHRPDSSAGLRSALPSITGALGTARARTQMARGPGLH